jgi:hypothetical protein
LHPYGIKQSKEIDVIMTSSGLAYGRPDDIIFMKENLTPVQINGSEWLQLNIATPLKLGTDTQSSIYIGIQKFNSVIDQIPNEILCIECYETSPYSTGNKVIYYDTGANLTVYTSFGFTGYQEINYYKLEAPYTSDNSGEYTTLHFRLITPEKVLTNFAKIKSLICTISISKSSLKDKVSPRPGHLRAVKRLAPIWN